MASTLKWIAADIESLLPSWSYATNDSLPEVGQSPPASPLRIPDGRSILLFTRCAGMVNYAGRLNHMELIL